ncbi:hypothetical protein A0H81_10686 [Grifola frondosa]|uniref:Uncharacterized protein n=1 Tax=Grifola frondosa TaxID=5627 RepID=A0A1C7LZG6_GRIFR|nr:hypothetical protein A0H81_10686 [Grifola frondosa]
MGTTSTVLLKESAHIAYERRGLAGKTAENVIFWRCRSGKKVKFNALCKQESTDAQVILSGLLQFLAETRLPRLWVKILKESSFGHLHRYWPFVYTRSRIPGQYSTTLTSTAREDQVGISMWERLQTLGGDVGIALLLDIYSSKIQHYWTLNIRCCELAESQPSSLHAGGWLVPSPFQSFLRQPLPESS